MTKNNSLLLISFIRDSKDVSCLIDFLSEGETLADARPVPVTAVGFEGFQMVASQFSFIEFQGFLLGSLSGVGHIAFAWLLNTIDI